MTLYQQDSQSPSAWPEPMETIYQSLGLGTAMPKRFKRPDVSLCDRFFIAAVANQPPEQRPWGSLTWLSEVFAISRPTVYSIANDFRQRVLSEPQPRSSLVANIVPAIAAVNPSPSKTTTPDRIQRTILTLALPGNASIRSMQQVLQEAFGETRSVGFISELITEAGRTAGKVLTGLDYHPLGRVIALRDETFFQDWAVLFLVEPHTGTILLAHVAEDHSADTWATALLVAQDSGVQISGLVEDMARYFDKSLRIADLKQPVQKDPWHVLDLAGRARRDLERSAYTALASVYRLEKQLNCCWDDACFEQDYIPAVAKADRLIASYDDFSQCREHLRDALAVVDWRSGEVRERASNGWLLDETIAAMQAIDHASVHTLVRTLRKYRSQLLTYLDWLEELLIPWRQRLAQLLPPAQEQTSYERAMARVWSLRQGVINGYRWRQRVAEAQKWLELLLADKPALRPLADDLCCLLDSCGHSSSLIETINGLCKSFLLARQALANRETAQAYLDLFVLWHNMRVFQRGKRAGKSPFQWAGIATASSDWLQLLGYPAA